LFNGDPVSSEERRYAPGIVPARRPGKEGGPREQNRRERTRTLCEAALVLFLQRGVESTTVDEITKAAGVAKGSFYRYFTDKEQLVEALFGPLADTVASAMDRCAGALAHARSGEELNRAYGTLAAELTQALLEAPAMVKLYLQECRGPAEGARRPIRELSSRIMRGAVALTRVAHAQRLLKELSPEVTAVAVVGAVEGMLVEFLEGRAATDPAAATADLITMVLDGIRRS
jgi:AcrR family transcriptional regulator